MKPVGQRAPEPARGRSSELILRASASFCLGLTQCENGPRLELAIPPEELAVVVFTEVGGAPRRVAQLQAGKTDNVQLEEDGTLLVFRLAPGDFLRADGTSIESFDDVSFRLDTDPAPVGSCERCLVASLAEPHLISSGDACAIPELAEARTFHLDGNEVVELTAPAEFVAEVRRRIRMDWRGPCGCEPPRVPESDVPVVATCVLEPRDPFFGTVVVTSTGSVVAFADGHVLVATRTEQALHAIQPGYLAGLIHDELTGPNEFLLVVSNGFATELRVIDTSESTLRELGIEVSGLGSARAGFARRKRDGSVLIGAKVGRQASIASCVISELKAECSVTTLDAICGTSDGIGWIDSAGLVALTEEGLVTHLENGHWVCPGSRPTLSWQGQSLELAAILDVREDRDERAEPAGPDSPGAASSEHRIFACARARDRATGTMQGAAVSIGVSSTSTITPVALDESGCFSVTELGADVLGFTFASGTLATVDPEGQVELFPHAGLPGGRYSSIGFPIDGLWSGPGDTRVARSMTSLFLGRADAPFGWLHGPKVYDPRSVEALAVGPKELIAALPDRLVRLSTEQTSSDCRDLDLEALPLEPAFGAERLTAAAVDGPRIWVASFDEASGAKLSAFALDSGARLENVDLEDGDSPVVALERLVPGTLVMTDARGRLLARSGGTIVELDRGVTQAWSALTARGGVGWVGGERALGRILVGELGASIRFEPDWLARLSDAAIQDRVRIAEGPVVTAIEALCPDFVALSTYERLDQTATRDLLSEHEARDLVVLPPRLSSRCGVRAPEAPYSELVLCMRDSDLLDPGERHEGFLGQDRQVISRTSGELGSPNVDDLGALPFPVVRLRTQQRWSLIGGRRGRLAVARVDQ